MVSPIIALLEQGFGLPGIVKTYHHTNIKFKPKLMAVNMLKPYDVSFVIQQILYYYAERGHGFGNISGLLTPK